MTKCRRCTMRPPPPSLPRVQSKRARRPGTFDEVRATSIYLFESSCDSFRACVRNFFVVGDHRWGRRNWGRRAKAYSISKFASPSKDSKNICASFFDEKRAIIPRVSLHTNLFPPRDTPVLSLTIKIRIFLSVETKFSLCQNIAIRRCNVILCIVDLRVTQIQS